MKKIIKFFKNFFAFKSVLIHDIDGDFTGFYFVIKAKLEKMLKYFQECGDNDIVIKLKRTLILLEIIIHEKYSFEPTEYYGAEFIPIIDPDDITRFEHVYTFDNLDQYFDRYKKDYIKLHGHLAKTTEEKVAIAMQIGEARQKKAEKLFFKMLEYNVPSYWN